MGFIRRGPAKVRTVSKIRRSKVKSYGEAKDWRALSEACLTRDRRRCRQCGTATSPGNRLQAHHIISIKMGGKNLLINLKTLCERCHSKQPHHGHLR